MHTIEYIGPRPQKPTRKPWAGGWLMIVLVCVGVYFVAKPFVMKALADNPERDALTVEETVAWLGEGSDFGNLLAAAALERTRESVTYDPAYYSIKYPMGDVPEDKGVCTDVVVRSYRALGIDLQQLVHEDMKDNFRIYPQLWQLKKPDTNIDHRRVPNLARFFSRKGQPVALPEQGKRPSKENFRYGDIVVWALPHGDPHIGVVVPGPGDRRDEKWIVHNNGNGPRWEDKLLDYQITGHFRYDGRR